MPARFLSLFISMLLLCGAATAQKSFEGTVTYSIEYLAVPAEIEGMESMLPKEMKLQFKGEKVRMAQEVMGGSQIVVSDGKAKSGFMLMDMMGQKIAVLISKEALEQEEANAAKVEITPGSKTKTILGHKCQQYSINDPNNAEPVEVFATKDLGDIKHQQYKKLDGFPLEYMTNEQGMKLRLVATSITKEALGNDLYTIPEGYQQMTVEQMQQMGF